MNNEEISSHQGLSNITRRHIAFFICLLLLILARLDLNSIGLALFLGLFSFLIFLELYLIRKTLIEVYADAITDNRFLSIVMKGSFINGTLSIILSIFFAANLLVFINLANQVELIIIAVCGLGLTWLTPGVSRISKNTVKEKPAAMFSRVIAISLFVAVTVILETAYTVISPVDARISEAFDENIPAFVIDDVQRSSRYFQHFLSSIAFLEMNIDSIRLSNDVGYWFDFVRFFLTLSPTPFIAFALLLMSITSIRKIAIVRGHP